MIRRFAVVAAFVAAAVVPANAATISFGGAAATGGGQRTALTGPGVTSETFNGTTGNCGVTSGMAVSGNSYQLVTGSQTNYYAAPAGDTTCYAAVYGGGNLTLDLAPLVVGKKYDYLGLYWGTINSANSMVFYNGNTVVNTIQATQVLSALGVPNTTSGAGTDSYVNIYFSLQEVFDKVVFLSNANSFEFDNVAVRQTPEPGALGLLGAGILGAALLRRRRAAR